MTAGSREPQRVAIGNPSNAMKLIVVSTLLPSCMAHMLDPAPRWATTTRPATTAGARCRKADAM